MHLHHEVDATSRQGKLMLRHVRVGGWGGRADVNVHVHLHHEVDRRRVRVRGGVGGVMLTFMCTCIMKLMLPHLRIGDGVGGVMLTFTCTCVMKLMVRHVS